MHLGVKDLAKSLDKLDMTFSRVPSPVFEPCSPMSVLRRLLILWLVLIGLAVAGGIHLVSWVSGSQVRNWTRYDQAIWSEDESQVAFIRYQIDPQTPTPKGINRELCVASRVEGDVRKVADLGDQDLQLLAWIDDDKRLLLMPRKPEGTTPHIFTASVAEGDLKEVKLSRDDIELVSISGGDVFFRRKGAAAAWEVPSAVSVMPGDGSNLPSTPTPTPTPTSSASPGLTREQLELLHWSPSKNTIDPVCAIPMEGDDIQIEDAVPSPDDKWVALVLKVGEEKAVWLYSETDKRLKYTHIKVAARALRMAWSWDSSGLVVAAELHNGCDFYTSSNVASGDFIVLHANTPGRAYQPFWPRGEKEFLLLDQGEILHFDPASLQAQEIMGRTFKGKRTENSAVSPRGSFVMFRSRENHDDVLYLVSLKVRELKPLLKADVQVVDKSGPAYLVGEGLRNAYRFWTGARPLPEDAGEVPH